MSKRSNIQAVNRLRSNVQRSNVQWSNDQESFFEPIFKSRRIMTLVNLVLSKSFFISLMLVMFEMCLLLCSTLWSMSSHFLFGGSGQESTFMCLRHFALCSEDEDEDPGHSLYVSLEQRKKKMAGQRSLVAFLLPL